MADQVTTFNCTFQAAATGVGNGTAIDAGGIAGVGFQIEGISGDTITFEATIDGTTWYSVEAINRTTGVRSTTATADGLFYLPIAGESQFRCRVSIYSAGTITITGKGVLNSAGMSVANTQPFSALLEGGLTELVGIDEEVNTDDYGGSVGVALAGTHSGEIVNFGFYATEDGAGAVQDSAGILYIFDANPTIAVGDTLMTAADRVTIIGEITVAAGDWRFDANGGSVFVYNQPVHFHPLSTLYFVWFLTDAQDLNDAAGDDEVLRFNFWYRRDS